MNKLINTTVKELSEELINAKKEKDIAKAAFLILYEEVKEKFNWDIDMTGYYRKKAIERLKNNSKSKM